MDQNAFNLLVTGMVIPVKSRMTIRARSPDLHR